jgi:Leucine-rich repeat (LRR) protein
MEDTKTFLGCNIRNDQYEILENIASQFDKTPKELFSPRGNRYLSTNEDGWINYILISNFNTKYFYNPPKEKRKFELPEQLDKLKRFVYDSDSSLGELIIPESCKNIEELSCVHNSLRSLILPKNLSNLKFLRCFCNELTELHLETATNLESLEFQHNNISKLYLPQSTSELSFVSYHNNPLSQEIKTKLAKVA